MCALGKRAREREKERERGVRKEQGKRLGLKLVMDTFETLLHETSELKQIFCFESVLLSVYQTAKVM